MSYLNPPYANNFQELCAAMPLYYLDVFEMRAVLRAQGFLLDGVCEGMEKLVDVNFILTADEATIRKWEKALKITYRNRLTLDQRKRVVIGYIIGLGHIGEQEIREIIGQYTPNAVSFDFLRGVITIMVEGEIFDEENLLETLLRRIPAHLGLKMSIHIRKEYRQTIPVYAGGAVGSYFFLEPVVPEHISSTQQLPMLQGGRTYTSFTGEPVTPHETIRTDLPLSHGGEITSRNDGGDTPPVGGSYRTGYTILQGATHLAENAAGDTPEVAGMAELRVPVAHSVFLEPQVSTDTPTVKRAVTGARNASGGLYCHTHIKSRLIE